MASMQRSREEHARSAAHKAADELAASRRDRDRDHEAAAPVSPRGGGGGGGILSNVMGAVRSTFSGGDARDDDSRTAGADATAGDYGEGDGKRKDGSMADAAMGKAAEAKDKATAAMESAKEYALDKKEGARRALAGDAVGRKGQTDESAWQQGQDVRRRAAEKAREEEARRGREPSEAEKGRAATENIYGKAAGATGAFGEKMVMPADVVEQKRAEAAASGGSREAAGASPTAGTGHGDEPEAEDVMLRVKAADQMTGQAFNDVGVMGEEGTGMPRRR